jgi:ribosomal protein S18 acetylase RimI-like enzyme
VHVDTRRAGAGDLDRASVVLGEAFADYAWTRWTVDADDHVRRVTALQRVALEHLGLALGQVWVSAVDGCVEAVAVWMDSDVPVPPAVEAHVRARTAELEGARHGASVSAEREIGGWRPARRHHYLATVGTSPSMQRRGLATAVLAPVIRAADEEGVGAFLETSSTSNVAFYERLGFEVTGHRVISGGGPDVWAMLRDPR